MPLLAIVPPVVDHCSAAAAPLLSMPREVMTTTVSCAAWNGRSETRPGVIRMPSTRATSGDLELPQPRTGAPAITPPNFIRAGFRVAHPPAAHQRECESPRER